MHQEMCCRLDTRSPCVVGTCMGLVSWVPPFHEHSVSITLLLDTSASTWREETKCPSFVSGHMGTLSGWSHTTSVCLLHSLRLDAVSGAAGSDCSCPKPFLEPGVVWGKGTRDWQQAAGVHEACDWHICGSPWEGRPPPPPPSWEDTAPRPTQLGRQAPPPPPPGLTQKALGGHSVYAALL